MKIPKLVLLTIPLMLMAASCNKDKPETTTIYGQLLTKGTTTPHAGVHVWLGEENAGGQLGGGGSTQYNGMRVETYTDAEGRYTLKYDLYQTPKYYLHVDDVEGHWGPIAKKLIKPGGSVEANVKYIPFAYLVLHIKNVNPINGYDYVGFSFLTAAKPSLFGFDGSGIDTQQLIKAAGNGDNIFRWASIKNEVVQKEQYDTIFIPMGDTVFHEVFY